MKITVTITKTDSKTVEKAFDRVDIAISWSYMKIQMDDVASVHIEKEN